MKIENLYKKVLVALSGGVDSSVAALLLKKQGFDVAGAYMKLNNTSKNAEDSARAVAKKLGIKFYVLDGKKEFQKQVIDYFISSYESGVTPNPCVVCNKIIKFGWLLNQAKALGFGYIATGHYCNICNFSGSEKKDVRSLLGAQVSGKRLRPTFFPNPEDDKIDSSIEYRVSNYYSLLKAKDTKKDQTYFLWQLEQKQLKHVIFPLGNYTKDEVRKIAQKYDLPTCNNKESQDICFIKDKNIEKFLKQYSKKLQGDGNIVDMKGNILARHRGLIYYNIGKREKLGRLDLNKFYKNLNPHKLPAIYVIKLDVANNQLIVGLKEDLYASKIVAKNISWINPELIKFPLKCQAHIRYHALEQSCTVRLKNNELQVKFAKPVFAVTPGQSIVFYKDDILLGGGIIK